MDKDKDIELTTYELGYLLIPTLADEQALEEANKITSSIEQKGGALGKQKNPEMIDLAYGMSKEIQRKRHNFDKAHFGSVVFDLDPENIASVKKELDDSDVVLRFLIVKVSKKLLEQQEAKRNYAPRKSSDSTNSKGEEKAVSGEALDQEIDALIAGTEVDDTTNSSAQAEKQEEVKTE